MTQHPDAKVFIVDDDAGVRGYAMAWLLRTRRLLSERYVSADAFLAEITRWSSEPSVPCCLLLDVRMPGTRGLAQFERLAERGLLNRLPVIFLTGHGDVPTAVAAVKRGAFDFVEKPLTNNLLVDRIEQALTKSAEALAALRHAGSVKSAQAELTDREREVMQLDIAGRPNKLIADELNISVRTVEVHRARVFEKMAVRSAVELTNK